MNDDMGFVIRRQAKRIIALEKQRNELRAALGDIRDWVEQRGKTESDIDQHITTACTETLARTVQP